MGGGAGGLMRAVAWGVLVVVAGASAPHAARAAEPRVVILDDEFATPRVDVAVGTGVVFENRGRQRHSVVADEAGFDTGDLPRDEQVRIRFDTAGVYRYHCVHHGAPGGRGMSALVVVGGAQTPAGPAPRTPRPEGPRTIQVPKDAATIQQGVDAAQPGDLVLVAPGTYEESVVVATPGIELRGADRNAVVLDGAVTKETGVLVAADGVTVQNLTARRYRTAGFSWWGVKGFRGSYLSAGVNGSYGVRAFASRSGVFDHVYAAGHPGAGISVAACTSCETTVLDAMAERNGVGFLAVNTAGAVTIARSEAHANGAGIVATALDSVPRAALEGLTIAGNWVHGSASGPAFDPLWLPAGGTGILVAGARASRVERNRLAANRSFGILVSPAADRSIRLSRANRVAGNAARGNGAADLALGAPAGGGNCFASNGYRWALPPGLPLLQRCGSPAAALGGGDGGPTADRLALVARTAHVLRTGQAPAPAAGSVTPQPPMPDAGAAPPQPATSPPPRLDLRTASLPDARPSSATAPKEVRVFAVKLSDPVALALGLYAYLLPLALYAAWVSVAMWDIARREGLSGPGRVGRAAFVLGVPLVGPVGYLALGATSVPKGLRLFLTIGGLGLYVLLAAISFSLGRA